MSKIAHQGQDASPEQDMALTVVANDPATTSLLEALAVRMADEHIPVRAIARATRLPSDDVYAVLRNAIAIGQIVEMPRDDWPSTPSRGNRVQAEALQDEDILRAQLSLKFKVTKQESAILASLLKRDFVTKEQLHQIIESNRPGAQTEETDPKQIDVLLCKIRKKLKPHDIAIETLWNTGYSINAANSAKAIQMLQFREAA
jgi:two-component system cell cycle response regulator CtrA